MTAGGATGVAAVELAQQLGIRRVVIPRETSVLCALGALQADLQWSSVASHPGSLRAFDFPAINKTLGQLVANGGAFLDQLKVPPEARRTEIFAAARYPMQVTEIEVPCPVAEIDSDTLDDLADSFHTAHRERYAVAEPDADVEFVMWRVVVRGVNPGIGQIEESGDPTDCIVGETEFYDAGSQRRQTVPLVDIDRMGAGPVVSGPALLVASDTTVVVPSGARVSGRPGGHLMVEID